MPSRPRRDVNPRPDAELVGAAARRVFLLCCSCGCKIAPHPHLLIFKCKCSGAGARRIAPHRTASICIASQFTIPFHPPVARRIAPHRTASHRINCMMCAILHKIQCNCIPPLSPRGAKPHAADLRVLRLLRVLFLPWPPPKGSLDRL